MVRRRRARLSAFQKMLQCPRAACVWQALLYATDVHVPIVLSARQGRFPRRLNRFLPEIGSIRFPLSSYSLFSRRCGHFSGGKFGVCIRARRQRSLQIEPLCRLPRANLLLFLDFWRSLPILLRLQARAACLFFPILDMRRLGRLRVRACCLLRRRLGLFSGRI